MRTQPKLQLLKKTLLISGLTAILAVGSAHALESNEKKADRMYVDPVTGESKYAKKLLSEMSDTEKALLSNEEYRALKELEAKLKNSKPAESKQKPNSNGE